MPRYTVEAYELGLAYGGPEEGGWWYDTGTRARHIGTFNAPNREATFARMMRLNGLLRVLQRKAVPVSSSVYPGGRYGLRCFRIGEPVPEYYPQERPYYE